MTEVPLPRKPLVLMYHGFGTRDPERDPHNLFVPAEDLDHQLSFLTRFLRPLSLPEYIAGWDRGRWPVRSFLVTIDDGYISTLDVAAPILLRHRVPAVLFVPPARLGTTSGWMPEMPDEPLLPPEALPELTLFGIDVGVHGMSHRRLPSLPSDELREEVLEARASVEALTGRPARSFSYPEGLFDAAAVAAVREARYDVAFSVEEGSGRFTVPRLPVTSRDSFTTFVAKLVPGYPALYRMTRENPRVRRVAARLVGQRPR